MLINSFYQHSSRPLGTPKLEVPALYWRQRDPRLFSARDDAIRLWD